MPNIASILKEEIARVARKQVRGEIASLKKATTTHRAEIAELKRRAQAAEKQLKALSRWQAKTGAAKRDDEPSAGAVRFSAKGLASQRRRLGLSAEDCGRLVGASGQSVYNWEAGKARPRAVHLAAIAGLKAIGKREAAVRLAAPEESGQKKAR